MLYIYGGPKEVFTLPGYSFQKKNVSIGSDHMNSFVWIPGKGGRINHEADYQ
jgi:hypothetical protein